VVLLQPCGGGELANGRDLLATRVEAGRACVVPVPACLPVTPALAPVRVGQ
jgi:hypothetical protein